MTPTVLQMKVGLRQKELHSPALGVAIVRHMKMCGRVEERASVGVTLVPKACGPPKTDLVHGHKGASAPLLRYWPRPRLTRAHEPRPEAVGRGRCAANRLGAELPEQSGRPACLRPRPCPALALKQQGLQWPVFSSSQHSIYGTENCNIQPSSRPSPEGAVSGTLHASG